MDASASICGAMKLQPIRFGLESPVLAVLTSINRTLLALEKAGQLVEPLTSGIGIPAVQTVPHAPPQDGPSVPFEFLVRRLGERAAQFPMQTMISSYLCRDRLEALKRILNRNSLGVTGVMKRWWPTRDKRGAQKLRRAGYNVIFVETG